jgi:hypothetical protein
MCLAILNNGGILLVLNVEYFNDSLEKVILFVKLGVFVLKLIEAWRYRRQRLVSGERHCGSV